MSVPAVHGRHPNMTMDNPPFEEVLSIENGDFPKSC